MKKLLLLSITAAMLMGFTATAQAPYLGKVMMPGPKGAFPIAIGDIPADFANGKVYFVVQDSVSLLVIPAHVILTSGKKKLETDIVVASLENMQFTPFSPKDSVDIVVTSPGYRPVKEKIKIKSDQYINIRMVPIQE